MMPRGIDAVLRRSNQFGLDAIGPTYMSIVVAVAIGIFLLPLAVDGELGPTADVVDGLVEFPAVVSNLV